MPSKDDVFEGNQCRILVNPSQSYFHLYRDGDTSEIRLPDIANAISRQCRFTGHLLSGIEIYSVAEHCVLVSHIVEAMGGDPQEIFEGLMHDSSEAYLSDISAPFKRELGGYYDKEALITSRIAERFGLLRTLPEIVKKADWYALFIEARQIVCKDEEELKTWVGYEEHGEESLKYQVQIRGWLPSQAKTEFLCRFADCIDKLNGWNDA